MKISAILLLALAAGLSLALRAFHSSEAAAVGQQTTYYANGQVDTECAVVDGRRDGSCRRFYPDGNRMEEGRYAAGKMEGEWTFWRRDGSVDADRSGTYRAGVKVGS